MTSAAKIKPTKPVTGVTDCRLEVQEFACLMEKILRQNDWKAGWKHKRPHELAAMLQQESRELNDVLIRWMESRTLPITDRPTTKDDDYKRIVALQAADVANVAMFLVDVCGALNANDL